MVDYCLLEQLVNKGRRKVKYKFEIKGRLLTCGHCNSDPQFFPRYKDKLLCDTCDKEHDFKEWIDPIDIELSNFNYEYRTAISKYNAGIQLKKLMCFF